MRSVLERIYYGLLWWTAGGLESTDKLPTMLSLMGGNTDLEQRLLLVRPSNTT